MIINDLDLIRIAFVPHETHPVLVVDPDAVLTHPVVFQRFQPLPGSDKSRKERAWWSERSFRRATVAIF
jgi:hypothetical protein